MTDQTPSAAGDGGPPAGADSLVRRDKTPLDSLGLRSDISKIVVWVLDDNQHTGNAVRIARYLLASVVLLAVVAGLIFWLVPASQVLAPYLGAAGGAAGVTGISALRRRRRRAARRDPARP